MKRLNVLRTLTIAAAVLSLPSLAWSQSATDPFAQRHAELLRAAEAQLRVLHAHAGHVAPEALPHASDSDLREEEHPLAAISDARVEHAAKRLLALGLDAGRIFAEEGVPRQLLVVAEIESGFNPSALSPKGARGLWQFMPETARRYGLRVDEQADERLSAARSTRAAARYLRDLYLLFGDWQLALAAYNAGEQRIAAAIDRAGSRDFKRFVDLLPGETRRYVSAIINEM